MNDLPVNLVSVPSSEKGAMSIPFDSEENKKINSNSNLLSMNNTQVFQDSIVGLNNIIVPSLSKEITRQEYESQYHLIFTDSEYDTFLQNITTLGINLAVSKHKEVQLIRESEQKQSLPPMNVIPGLGRNEFWKNTPVVEKPFDPDYFIQKIVKKGELSDMDYKSLNQEYIKLSEIQKQTISLGINKFHNDARKLEDKKEEDMMVDIHNNIKKNNENLREIALPIDQKFEDVIGPYLTNKRTPIFHFQAKNVLLIFNTPFYPDNNETTNFIKGYLKSIYGEGEITFKFEREYILVWAQFENKIDTKNPDCFNIYGRYCGIYTVSKTDQSHIIKYITGFDGKKQKKLPANFPTVTTFEEIKSIIYDGTYLNDVDFKLMITAAQSKNNATVGDFIRTVLTANSMLVGVDRAYKFNKENVLYEPVSFPKLLNYISKWCTIVLDEELKSLLITKNTPTENTKEAIARKDRLIADIAKLKQLTGQKAFVTACKTYIEAEHEDSFNQFELKVDRDKNCAAVKGNKIVCFLNGKAYPRTKDHAFSFEYPVNFIEQIPEEISKPEAYKLIDKFLIDITLGNDHYRFYLIETLGYGITGWMTEQKGYFYVWTSRF